MISKHDGSPSRRVFLNAVVAGAAATATGTGFAHGGTSNTSLQNAGIDAVRRCDLNGIVPASHVVGGVLVETAKEFYLVFDAGRTGETSTDVSAGSGVLRLQGCYARKTRSLENQDLVPQTVDFSKLQICATYEVHNSTWIGQLVKGDRDAASGLHHYVITYGNGLAFECVVSRLDAHVSPLPFPGLYKSLLKVSGAPSSFDPGFVSPVTESTPVVA